MEGSIFEDDGSSDFVPEPGPVCIFKFGNFSIQPARADTCLRVETQGKGRPQESGTKKIDPNKTHS